MSLPEGEYIHIQEITDDRVALVYTNGRPINHRVHTDFASAWINYVDSLVQAGCTRIVSGGINNRRKISGSDKWSAHAFGKAIDINAVVGITMNQAASLARPWFHVVLWNVAGHYDHIHINTRYDPYADPPDL